MNCKNLILPIRINTDSLDETQKKLNRLSELIEEANQIIDSLTEIKLEIKIELES